MLEILSQADNFSKNYQFPLAALRCQIWFLREISCRTVVSRASGELCAPRSGLHKRKSCKTLAKSSLCSFSLPDSASTRNLLQNGGVESSWGALCAEIWLSRLGHKLIQDVCPPLIQHFFSTDFLNVCQIVFVVQEDTCKTS